MGNLFKFDEKVLEKLSRGLYLLAKAVKVTLGPKGRNVVIGQDNSMPFSTKDGVTVAKEIKLKDKFENMAAAIVKEASSQTAKVAGDGTTTAIVLTEAIFSEGAKNLSSGANPMEIKKGIDVATKEIIKELEKKARAIKTEEEIKQIATISANNDEEVGNIVAKALKKVGKNGIVTLGEAKGIDTVLEVVEGMQFDKGYLSPHFITNSEKMIVDFENPYILITDEKISMAKQLVPILEKVHQDNSRPIFIIAEDVEGEALATLVVNKLQGNINVCCVKAPMFGENRKQMLEDIAILTGGNIITKELGKSLEDMDISDLGTCKKIKTEKESTTIIGGMGKKEEIEKRVLAISNNLKACTSDYEKEKLQERLAKLSGGIGVVHVGAATEAEMKEKKDRVDDALHATKAAILEGVIPGGGLALLRASSVLNDLLKEDKYTKDEKVGIAIIKKACLAPIKTISRNSGEQGEVIAEKVLAMKGDEGFNGLTNKFSDLLKDGVIDPLLVTKSALNNASSVASMLLTIAVLITDKPKKEDNAQPSMSGMGMGGMPPMGGMPGMGMPGMGMM